MKCRIPISRLLCWLALCLFPAEALALVQDPVGTLGARVEGALGSFRAAAGWETTEVNVQLGSGESAQLRVPLLARRQSMELSMGELADAEDRVTWMEPKVTWPAPWGSLPYSLQGRSLSPLENSSPSISGLHWAWLGMSLLLVAALRRRPYRALLLGSALAGSLFLLPSAAPAQAPQVTLFEGDAPSGRWLEVRGAQDRLSIEGVQPGWLRRLPSNAEGRLELERGSGSTWAACFEGARIYYMCETSRHPQPGIQGPGRRAMRRTWLRRPGEGWSAHGAWPVSQGFPEAIAGDPGPPGWLVAGLPQGVGVLLGELEPEAGGSAWVRLVGFELAP